MSYRAAKWASGMFASLAVWAGAHGGAWAHTLPRLFDETGLAGARDSVGLDHSPPARDQALGADAVPRHDPVVALVNARGFACSGVLVHRRAVLSARHCIGSRTAVFGANVDALVARRTVVRTVPVPNSALDLALFVLDTAAPVEPYPIRIPSTPPDALRVVGFGCTDAECRGGAGRRSYFDVHLRPEDWACSVRVSAQTGCIPKHEMVLTRGQGADTCTGDSGGPVLQRTAEGWAVIAITSRAVSDSVLPCGDGGIYVGLVAVEQWLKGELGRL